MSKKLIAVAAAAALALTGLVGVAPASATTSLTITGGSADSGATADVAKTINVPSADTLGWSTAGNTTATAIRVVVTTAAATGTVNVTSTGGVKLVTTAQYDDAVTVATSATGSQSLTAAAVSNSYTFYVTTTSTATGTFTVTEGGNTLVRHIKGLAGPAYKLTVTGPTSVSSSVKSDILVKAFDAFGNQITTLAAGNFTVTYLGGAEVNTTASATGTAYRSASKDQALYVQGTATAGPAAITVALTGNSTQVAAANVTAFGSRDLTKFISINNVDLNAAVTALNAQVAALTAQLAASVSKAKYNKLAKRWNRANPSNKVKLAK